MAKLEESAGRRLDLRRGSRRALAVLAAAYWLAVGAGAASVYREAYMAKAGVNEDAANSGPRAVRARAIEDRAQKKSIADDIRAQWVAASKPDESGVVANPWGAQQAAQLSDNAVIAAYDKAHPTGSKRLLTDTEMLGPVDPVAASPGQLETPGAAGLNAALAFLRPFALFFVALGVVGLAARWVWRGFADSPNAAK